MPHIRQKTIAGLRPGDSFSVSRTFTQQDTLDFAALSRDYNPIHFDQRFVEAKNFRAPICHGLLVGSLLTEIGGQIGWLASGMNFRFRRPVYFGDTIECSLTINEVDERLRAKADALFKNQHGEVVIEAQVSGIIPGPPEQRILAAILSETEPTKRGGA